MRFVNVPAHLRGRPSLGTIRAEYRHAINQVRPFPAPLRGEISVTFGDDQWAKLLPERRVFGNIFVGVEEGSQETRERWSDQVDVTLGYLRRTNPALAMIVDLLVTDIVVLNSESVGGGRRRAFPVWCV